MAVFKLQNSKEKNISVLLYLPSKQSYYYCCCFMAFFIEKI